MVENLHILRSLKLSLVFILLATSCHAAINNISDEDGSPSVYPWKLKVTNGTLTNNLDGTASLAVGASIGGTITSGTTGSVLFVNPTGIIAQDNANFFWDDTNNRLGIGTASPASKLVISDSSTPSEFQNDIVNATNYGRFAFYEGATLGAYLQYIGSNYGTASRRANFEIAQGTGGQILFGRTSNTIIYVNGQVGIGTDATITPNRKLKIGLAADSWNGIEISANSSTWGIDNFGSLASPSNTFRLESPSGNYFYFTNAGRLGFNNSAPDALLEITRLNVANNTDGILISNTNAAGWCGRIAWEGTASGNTYNFLSIAADNGGMYLYTPNASRVLTERMTVDTFGTSTFKATGNSVVDIRGSSESPYSMRIFNQTFSATVPVFEYYGYNSGTFASGTSSAEDWQFYTNGLANVRMTLTSAGALNLAHSLGILTTSSSTVGVINQNSTRFIHSYGNNNLFIGGDSGNFTLTSTRVLGIGANALAALTSASNTVAIGYNAGTALTTGGRNTFIGDSAGSGITGGVSNTLIGYTAGNVLATNASSNTVVGDAALRSQTSGDGNTAVGRFAGASGTGGTNNTFLGLEACDHHGTTSSNTILGAYAVGNGTALTTGNITAVGFEAFYGANGAGGNGSAVGYRAGRSVTTGVGNQLFGTEAGYNPAGTTANAITTGTYNTFVGYRTGGASSTQRNRSTALGYQALVDADDTISLGDASANIIIGGTTASAKVHIIKTTEQLRVGYDASNYYSTTVGSTGGVTFDAVGSGSAFTFSDNLLLTGKITTYNNVVTEGYGVPAIVDVVALTGQVADITTTNITNAGTAGLYRVSYVMEDTTADALAGVLTLTISWTDGAGATTHTNTQVLTATGRASGVFFVQLASGNLTYATSHTGIFSNAVYALYIETERVN